MGYYSAIRMKYAFWSNMDGPGDYHIKWSKSDRERKICMTLFICGILKKKTYLQDRNRVKDLKKEFMIIVGEGWGKG